MIQAQVKEKEEAEKQIAQKLATLDLSGFKTDFLLNKGVFTESEIAYFRNKPRNKQGQIVMTTSAEDWQNLYERIVGADLRANGKGRVPNFEQFAEKNRLKQSKNNVIPIGILNVDAILMSNEQLDENAKQKENKKKANADKYEKISIVSASVLQEDIYEADVRFKISKALNFGGAKNDIKRLEIDFQDGKGWRSYPLNDNEIAYRFESVGERVVALRLLTERGPYVFYSKVNIKQLERPKVHREFEISTEGISQDTINKKTVKGGREAAINVVGGNVRIILSCDQYFDKPIIIGEGFDLGNDVGLDDIAADYRRSLQFLIDRGYDLVLLDYWDARAAIENNAQVLKRVIREVNNTKQGNEKLVVIGESMSGLVARWALREMENAGENHNVKLYISFDSPHQGANLPVSVTNLYWEASPSLLTNVLLPLLPRTWRNYYTAIQTPAAAQMLLHYSLRPRWMFPMGGPHPYFQDFRNRLAALGNNGYPQQCRNVAVTNGSSDGSDRQLFNNYGYGSNIINSTTPYLLQNTYIEAYTNKIDENSLNLRFATLGLFVAPTLAILNYSSPFNDDFLPGGRSSFAIPQRLAPFQNISPIIPNIPVKEFRFCFVPTFSAIDYQGDRSSQNSREFLNVINTNQHPFAAVYGNFTTTIDVVHVAAFLTNWERLARDEGLLGNEITCPGPPQPATPFVITNQSMNPCFENNQSVTFTTVNTGDIGQYSHDWILSPAALYGSGNTFTFNTNQLIAGAQYTLTCRRRFTNQGYSNAISSYSITFSVCEPTVGNASPCTFNQGDFVYLLGDGQGTYARYHNGTLYAAKTEGDTYLFVSRSTLIANGMIDTFANCFAETDPRGGGGSNAPLQNGCYTFKSKLSNKMMQMDNDGTGARIRQYGANGQNNQIFKLESVDGDAYKIMAATSNRTIESPGGNTGFGTELQLWDYNGSNHQKWQFVNMNDGSYRLNPKNESQVVMDVSQANSNDGNLIHLWGIHNGDNQRFIFQSVGCPNSNPPNSGGGCATGNFNGHFDYANCNSFSGWALDQNNFGRTVDVEIRVDGQLVATVAANGSRPDLVGAFGNNPQAEFHGWSYSIPANAPWRNGTNRTASARICGATNDLNESPKTVNCTGGTGGCTPPAVPNLSANPASINGGQSSTLLASGCGGAVSWNTNQTGNSITVSPAQTTTYTATCSANGCTSGSGSVTVTVNGGVGGNCATGNFNGHFDYANCGNFGGWALDQNNFGRTVDVEIRVDGQLVATVAANGSRPDLVGAFGNNPQAEFHGWSYSIPANAPWRNGTNRTASARICGATNDLNESPKTVNCTGGTGGCTPPAAPNLSANPASINGGQSSTLSASGCGGTVGWNTNQTGNSITVSPAQTTTYTATCSANGCTSGSGSVTVTVNGGGGGCATGNFNGHLDYANCGNFGGWALDQNNFGRTVEVEILINGQLVATIPANQSRSDLVAAFGTPQAEFHGWTYNVPANAPWRNGTVAVVARPCGGSNNLINSPANVNFSNCRVGAIEDLTERSVEPPLLDLVLSPNPTDGQVRVETWLAEAGAVQIAVQDLTGRTAKGFDFKAKSGNFSQLLNLTDLPVGVYLLQLQTTQKRFVKKMILVR